MTMFFIQNQNPEKGIKETTILNNYSDVFRKSDFAKRFVKQEGFDLAFDFKWEYTIEFNKKSGFIVFREEGNMFRVFVYQDGEDLNSVIYEVKSASPIDGLKKGAERFIRLVSDIYRAHIQNS